MPLMDELNGASSSPARPEQSSVLHHDPETSAAPSQTSQGNAVDSTSASMPPNLDGATTSPVTQPIIRLPTQAAQALPAVNGTVTPASQSQSRRVNGHQGHGHQVNGHQVNGHQVNGHQVNGHQVNGHQVNGHQVNGHQVNGHQINGHNPLLQNTATEAAEEAQTSRRQVDPTELLRHLGFEVVSLDHSTTSTATDEIDKFRRECPQGPSADIKLIIAFILRWEDANPDDAPDLLYLARSVSIIVDVRPAWQGPPKYKAMAHCSHHGTPSMIVAGTYCYTLDEAMQSLHHFLKVALHDKMTKALRPHGEYGYVSSDLGM